jgi:hypothetical protein
MTLGNENPHLRYLWRKLPTAPAVLPDRFYPRGLPLRLFWAAPSFSLCFADCLCSGPGQGVEYPPEQVSVRLKDRPKEANLWEEQLH